MKRKGNAERRRRENRGAEGAEGGKVWGGGCAPSEIFLIFLTGNGAFWCIWAHVLMLV